MTLHNRCLAICATLLFVFADSAVAQSTGAALERPRVGLVLGGGGARGAAHIGVLRELERQRIPIDAIAGTSMGAIVGGLYASGMSVDDLEKLIESLNWKEAFTDDSSRRDLRFRRKEDDVSFPAPIEFGYRDGEILIPKGVIQGQKLGLILRKLTLPAAAIDDFDELEIPFRAVASDLGTGEAYVMDGGDLALAIRASMSLPAVFSPVELDGRVLVDGGLVSNVPVDAIRSMGVDVIIAVDVEFPLYPPEQLDSAVAITAQVLTVLIRKDTVRQLAELDDDDVLIRPDLGEFGSADFTSITKTIQPGVDATAAASGKLANLALSAEQFDQHLAARVMRSMPEERLAFVRVIDDGPFSSRVVLSRLHTAPGDRINHDRIARDADRLHGLSFYEQVDYRILEEGGKFGVEFNTRAKEWGPNFINFGLSLEDNFEGRTAFNLAGRVTRAGINALGAEWRTDLQLGTNPVVFTEFYQPLSFDSRFFVAPRLQYQSNSLNVFVAGDEIARYRVSGGELGLDVGREFGLWGEFRLGVLTGKGDAKLKTGQPVVPNIDFDEGAVFARFRVDTLDDAQIPLSGTRLGVEWLASRTGLGADDSFDLVTFDMIKAWTRGRHTINAGLSFNTSVDSDSQLRNLFSLGGFLNLSGLARGQLSGQHSGVAKLLYYRRTGAIGGLVDLPFYVGASLEGGNVWAERSDISFDSLRAHGSVFAGFGTFFGPLILAAGFGEGGEKNFYLTLGNSIL
ncbi:MAG: patatin-like phospholipase family protein [Gammaproteobacteria bacterium]|nr:patatin-like phospholipase family protein [Gammaproteobacteria bacterium]